MCSNIIFAQINTSKNIMKSSNLLVKVFVLSILLTLMINKIYAQDIIVKKDNETIKAKIIEVGTTEIKYKLFDSPDGPTFTINKREVKSMKIHSENGKSDKVMNVTEDPMSAGNAGIVDKTSSLKFHFFSPLTHKLAFSYEWMVKPGFNWEAGFGIVGPGVGLTDQLLSLNPRGFYIRTGPKFLLGSSSDIEIDGARYAHPLKGRYFKIEAILYTLSKNYQQTVYNGPNVDVRGNYNGAALNLIYGRQYIFGNSITVGWYFGLGYGMESKTETYSAYYQNISDYDPIRYSHYYYGKSLPLTTTAGFNIGYIFKTPAWISNIGKSKQNVKAPSRHSMGNE